jgi:hypothetical protein
VHYGGFAQGLRRAPVEEISLARFGRGHPVWIRLSASTSFESREVIHRARSRIGEDCYRLFTNNCEHFCEWCLRGTPRSYQVEALWAGPVRACQASLRIVMVRCSWNRCHTPRNRRETTASDAGVEFSTPWQALGHQEGN